MLKNRKNFLITFNFEDALSKNEQKKLKKKNLFLLGYWCKNNKDNFQNSNFNKNNILNFYKPKDYKKKTQDCIHINEIYEDLLANLKKNLNIIHKKNYSKRYWEILLSRWLFTFIVDIFANWQLASKVKLSQFSKILSLKLNKKMFISENTLDYHVSNHTSDNKFWAHHVFIEILKFIHDGKIKNLELKIRKDYPFKNSFKDNSGLNISKVIYKNHKKKILFYNTSFNKRMSIDFFKKNLFFNYFHSQKKIFNEVRVDYKVRNSLYKLFPKKSGNLYKFLYKFISDNIPKVFLENYKFLETAHEKLSWPRNLDYICSSYGQYYDEVFKLYTAKEVSKKAKLFLFQHGYGGIFADKDFYNIYIDSKISDKYFSWGNNKKLKYKNFFYTKDNQSYNKFSSKRNNKFLFLLYGFRENPLRPMNGFENGYQTNDKTIKYFFDLYNNTMIPKSKIYLRIQDNYINYIQNSIIRKCTNLNIEDWKKLPLKKSLKSTDLSINFFLGTTFIESLFYNKPTILIYDQTMNMNFDRDFSNIIEQLKKNNIVFCDTKKAGQFINKNYLNIERWWNKKKVQKIREKFCLMYCNNYRSDKNLKIFKN